MFRDSQQLLAMFKAGTVGHAFVSFAKFAICKRLISKPPFWQVKRSLLNVEIIDKGDDLYVFWMFSNIKGTKLMVQF